jgi:quercetin dioxygenase-like cupin family protein
MRYLFLLLSCVLFPAGSYAQTPVFPRGNLAPNVHHTGDVWLYSVSRGDSVFDYNVTQATSAPGSKLDWHLHPNGQQLLITDGVGYYQERGGPLQIMRKGDVIKSAPGVEHWHAATPDSGVVYLAIYGGGGTEWLEPVDEEVYQRGPMESGGRGAIERDILRIEEQGSFLVGGSVVSAPGTFDPVAHGYFNPADQSSAGQTLHGDHAYVFYQRPVDAREHPIVMWHGYGQFSKTWETTPDGREGFQTLFLRRRYPVYVLDQPRRGRAGRSTEPTTIGAAPSDQLWFGIFRLGVWPDFYEGVQFDRSPATLNQYFRQITPDTGPLDIDLNVAAITDLLDTIGRPSILMTHSHSGGMGWLTAMQSDNIAGIVSFEPGSNFPFPEGEVPEPIDFLGGRLAARGVPMEDFERLTRIPIVI